MYCPKCVVEIQLDNQKECPVCGSTLTEFLGKVNPEAYELSGNELKLKELIADVKKDLETLPGEANIKLQFENAASLKNDHSPDFEDQFRLDDSDENAFFLNLEKTEGAVFAGQEKNPFGHEAGEEDQDTFDLEKELNLSAEEKESLLGDASPDGASPLHVPEATTEELLAKTLDELDQLHPVSEQPSSQRIPAFVVIGVLTLCAAAGSFFYLTSKQGPPPVIPVAQTNLAAKSAAAAPLRQKQEAENKPVMIPEAAQDNATRPAPSIPAEQQKPDSAKSAPSQPPSAERAKAEAGGLQPQEAKLLSPAAPAEKTHSVPGAEKKLAPIYAIHTDSYKTEETAIREINRLKKSGFDSYLQTADLKEKGVWQRVLTGKFSFPEEALKVQQELKKKYNKLDARIIAIEP